MIKKICAVLLSAALLLSLCACAIPSSMGDLLSAILSRQNNAKEENEAASATMPADDGTEPAADQSTPEGAVEVLMTSLQNLDVDGVLGCMTSSEQTAVQLIFSLLGNDSTDSEKLAAILQNVMDLLPDVGIDLNFQENGVPEFAWEIVDSAPADDKVLVTLNLSFVMADITYSGTLDMEMTEENGQWVVSGLKLPENAAIDAAE